jgi:hypothetical protein
MGAPVVLPSNTPERMRTCRPRAAGWCGATAGARRSRSRCRSASLSASPGGQPSTMPPMAGPWLSPKLVTTKDLPKLLPDMGRSRVRRRRDLAAEVEPLRLFHLLRRGRADAIAPGWIGIEEVRGSFPRWSLVGIGRPAVPCRACPSCQPLVALGEHVAAQGAGGLVQQHAVDDVVVARRQSSRTRPGTGCRWALSTSTWVRVPTSSPAWVDSSELAPRRWPPGGRARR